MTTGEEQPRVVIRDKRRIDPITGEVRAPAGEQPAGAPPGPTVAGEQMSEYETPVDDQPQQVPSAGGDDLSSQLAERTEDLQRVTAEYANYRKRVERDRVAVVEMATAGLLSGLLPVLDDIDRAREHGDLAGPFAAVAESLNQLTAKLGLEQFGEPGEAFDPAVHEALMQAEPDPSATVPTCAQVLQPGYRLRGGRVLRPARVSVAEPGAPAEQPAVDES